MRAEIFTREDLEILMFRCPTMQFFCCILLHTILRNDADTDLCNLAPHSEGDAEAQRPALPRASTYLRVYLEYRDVEAVYETHQNRVACGRDEPPAEPLGCKGDLPVSVDPVQITPA